MVKVPLNPKTFKETPLCDLCFEEALKIGSRKSESLKSSDFKETSIRFCIDGLYKWYKSFSHSYHSKSVFAMIRDASWYWASFCENDLTFSSVVKEYYSLLKDITENTAYTKLAERMDESDKIEKTGHGGRPFSINIPVEANGVIADCAVAIGVTFSVFFQLGLGKALSANQQGLYSSWSQAKIQPLFDEVMTRAKARLDDFAEIRNSMEFKMVRDTASSLHNVHATKRSL
jgi:hypothetical protein